MCWRHANTTFIDMTLDRSADFMLKLLEQSVMDAAKTSVAHYQNMITGMCVVDHGPYQVVDVPEVGRAFA